MDKIHEILNKIPGKWLIVIATVMGVICLGLVIRGFYLGLY